MKKHQQSKISAIKFKSGYTHYSLMTETHSCHTHFTPTMSFFIYRPSLITPSASPDKCQSSQSQNEAAFQSRILTASARTDKTSITGLSSGLMKEVTLVVGVFMEPLFISVHIKWEILIFKRDHYIVILKSSSLP